MVEEHHLIEIFSSSPHIDNPKTNLLVLSKGLPEGINSSIVATEKK